MKGYSGLSFFLSLYIVTHVLKYDGEGVGCSLRVTWQPEAEVISFPPKIVTVDG